MKTMTTFKFNSHPSAQCYVMYPEEDVYGLVSYNTFVAMYNHGEITCSGTYSATTRKHIGWFAKFLNEQYGTDYTYYSFKKAAGE